MIAVPPGSEPRLPLFRTVAAHFENADGEPVAGVRVVEPSFDSRPSLRGNLYAVVDLVGANPDRLMQAERLLGAIQRTYYAHPGSQSQVLTEAVRQARNKIDELNRALVPDRGHEPWLPGIVCASLVNGRLMVIHNGPAMALVTAGNRVERYPTELSSFGDPDLLTRPTSWEIYRQDVDTNVGLFIGTARWLDALDSRVIAGTVAHLTAENCRAAATGLSMEAMPYELPGVLLYAEHTSLVPKVPPILQNRVPTPPTPASSSASSLSAPPTPGSSATDLPADERRPRSTAGALPSSVHAKPPLRDIPAADQDDDATPRRASVAGRDPHSERSNQPP
ncbi:MAG: hypothetical protein KDD78_21120, partial [Caldilineaceae bacterium]|nr:hypothetical protein [Caldilineaceae bacterium]